MATLTLTDVTKEFNSGQNNEVTAVDEVSMTIDDGEFLVLVGPSGCGKSTTLRMIAGLETVTNGDITLEDRRINGVSPANRDIAMVFQSYALYPHMTVRENMRFGLEESTTLEDDVIANTVTETATLMDISELLDRTPAELSGGQQQRVALGRAIVRDPAVFLMDEPLSNLDAKLRATMRTELQRIQADLDVTTVYVTHDQTEAMTMGDRIAVLDDGTLQQVGTPLECYHTPQNRFVAGFIGEPSMNFFNGKIKSRTFVAQQFSYPLSEKIQSAIGGTREITLGVRPEDVILHQDADDTIQANNHCFDCVVDVVEPVGESNHIYLQFATDNRSQSETFIATVSGMQTINSGDNVIVEIPPEGIHLFDTHNGTALMNRSLTDIGSVETPRLQ
ncbi:ABC transporter ATP-binding protein [Haloquadratum walsbyi]|uniref:ABC-type D-xylose/L-arabinose transporter n=1 Tax=Haloquadratum walsbyi J07HQW2 TaxID=1238425 RepID=U1PLL2_9EURY|nr:sn-glycerol-3-phosphate ABC transporter ATP-binding protein UgpC [Haloquadratum walsbyi]ERG94592.1 MAG: ABC-type sugar transport system, ATPase component [Haloquadratum walsbyi J07HQW2]